MDARFHPTLSRLRKDAVCCLQPAPARWSATDGRRVLLRPVREDDSAMLQAFIDGLSPTSRLRRFHIGIASVPPTWLHGMTHPDARQELALLAIAIENGQAQCVGEARYAASDAGPPGEREFAVAVADAWQGVGLGSELLRSLAHHAGGRGVDRLVGDVMRDNLPMIEMARRNGYAVHTHPTDPRLLQVTRALHEPPLAELARLGRQAPDNAAPTAIVG